MTTSVTVLMAGVERTVVNVSVNNNSIDIGMRLYCVEL